MGDLGDDEDDHDHNHDEDERLQSKVLFNQREKKHHFIFSSQSSFKIPFLSFVFLFLCFGLSIPFGCCNLPGIFTLNLRIVLIGTVNM